MSRYPVDNLLRSSAGGQSVLPVDEPIFLPEPSGDTTGATDVAHLNAAIAAAPAGATLTAPFRAGVYYINATWTISKAVSISLSGATVRKVTGGTFTGGAVDCTVDGILFDGQGGTIDGNLVAFGATPSGSGIRNSGTGTVTIQNLRIVNNGSNGFTGTGASGTQLSILRNVISTGNVGPSPNTVDGFQFTGRFRCYACYAYGNDRHGFNALGNQTGSANGGSMFDGGCLSVHNAQQGFNLASTGVLATSTAGPLQAFDNAQGGVQIGGAGYWSIDSIISGYDGNAVLGNYSDGTGQYPSANGCSISGAVPASQVQVGSIMSRAPSGYGCAINQATDIQVGSIEVNGTGSYDGDPGVQIGHGSTRIEIGTILVKNRSIALSLGELTGAPTNIHVGTVISNTCSFAGMRFDSGCSGIRIGSYKDFNSYAVAPVDGEDALVNFFNCSDVIVDSVDQINDGTNKPKYIVHASASSSSCEVGLVRGSVFVTAQTLDSGVGNNILGVPQGISSATVQWKRNVAIAESIPRNGVVSNALANAPTSGTLMLVGGIVLPARQLVSNITFVSGTTALAGGTDQWFCLVRVSDKTIIAVTADDTSTAWPAGAKKQLAIAAPITPLVDTRVWVGIMVAATTVPTLTAVNLAASPAGFYFDAPQIVANSNTAQTTPLPVGTVVANPTSGPSTVPWCYVA